MQPVRTRVSPAARRGRALAAAVTPLALAAAVFAGSGEPALWAPPLLMLVVAVGEGTVVHVALRRRRWSLSLLDASLAAALLLAPGGWIPFAAAAGVGIADLRRRVPLPMVAFRCAAVGLTAAVGAVTTVSCPAVDRVGAASIGVAAGWAVGHVLHGFAVAATSRRGPWRLIAATAPTSVLLATANASVGLLAAWLADTAPLGLAGLGVPVALVLSSWEGQNRRAAEAQLFAELARGHRAVAGTSVDESARVVVTAAARLFGGADVDLLLLSDEGAVRYAGDEAGRATRAAVGPEAFDEPWVMAVLGGARRGAGRHTVQLGVSGGRPWCGVLVGPPDLPRAVLRASRPPRSAGFGRRDLLLGDVAADLVASWLAPSVLAPVPGPGRPSAAPVDLAGGPLLVLREAAGRLGRLADGRLPAGPDLVTAVVEELHAVERAAASLLGATAQAPDTGPGDLAGSPVPLKTGLLAGEWTTTGTLAPDTASVPTPRPAHGPRPVDAAEPGTRGQPRRVGGP